MIYGVGTDVVLIERLREMYERHGERCLGRLLADGEREDFASAPDPARFLAKRFAAKEAFGKALGTGVRVPATLTAVDALGNRAKTDATIGVDVLVIREGDVLKIKVPSIIFRENGDDFAGLAQETVDNNIRVLKRIAQILNKFKDYKVKVEGHANPVTRTAAEERSELQPLSEKRARAVRAKLIEFGVDSGRLSALGMGGTRPVVKWEDRENWWKNRRVEFILVK